MRLSSTPPRTERGASAVEYGLILIGIAALIVVVVVLLGGQVNDMFNGACENIQAETGTGECTGDGEGD
ncbi:Flp family type IVb pilin [Nocardioides dongxiaopingii]|uniref:Flp family type IVb pilin n=1 Tax=Nocardioides sp. S-1144 TaxID=2582905 RepID=UPI00110E4A98|nr:Flp family type IVb pilin [Nocardioides sp. S-1144]QCW51230.1 Flp family type IVb pilin [Nocardioides sp. S-1144]